MIAGMTYDIAIIGGGFYGVHIAITLSELNYSVVIIEKEDDLLTIASSKNQASIHNGYHYPRSLTTALQSRISYPVFINEFKDCIYDEFENYYLISKFRSKINSEYYENLCKKINLSLTKSKALDGFINHQNIASVYKVNEFLFDAKKIKDSLLNKLEGKNIKKLLSSEVEKIEKSGSEFTLRLAGKSESIKSKKIFNCTYSNINYIHSNNNIPLLDLKHEITETCLIRPNEFFKDKGITIMDGPFLSILPFPSIKNTHSFTHVSYTPHYEWFDKVKPIGPDNLLANYNKKSNWIKMLKDAEKYIQNPNEYFTYKYSNWEVKSVLASSEFDDSRPILYKKDFFYKNYSCILGAKIDNIYDIEHFL